MLLFAADATSDAFGVLLKEGGVWGAIVVLLCVALVAVVVVLFKVTKALLKAKDIRLKDREQMTETLTKVNDALRDQVIENNELATRLSLEATQSNDSVKEHVKDYGVKAEKLEDAIGALSQQQAILVVKLEK